ncbi:MAG: Uma2 family endonuclease [Isosphaeraceae bacterium]
MTTLAKPDNLATEASDGETRFCIPGVSYHVYETWARALPESTPIRMAYDGRSMELMVKGRKHDNYGELLGEIVRVITQELDIPISSSGETTWIRPEIERGLEADRSYYFLPEKLAMAKAAKARGSNDVVDYPNPDLAIEVDISPPRVDRPGIYAKLQVTEVWRFDGQTLIIERLGEDGRYHPVDASGFLKIRADDVRRWLIDEDSSDETAWARRLRTWVRTNLLPSSE